MTKAIAFGALALFAPVAFADEDAVARYRNYLPAQIEAMSEGERGHVPMMYSGAANLALSPFGDLVVQANLQALMYAGLSDLDRAKRAFQQDLGEPPTGELTVWQIHQLGYRAERQRLTPVTFLPFEVGGTIAKDYASVLGTVMIVDDRIADPINHVTIECSRTSGYCDYHQIALSLPDQHDFAQIYNVFVLADETYRITRWEGNQIDAVPVEANACRINQLSLNFATEEFFEIARNNDINCQLIRDGILQPLAKPRVSKIVDGREIIAAEFQRLRDEAYGYLSKSFRDRLEAARADLPKQ